MKTKIELRGLFIGIEKERGKVIVTTPFYIDMYDFGFVQSGKDEDGYMRWSPKSKEYI